MEMEKKLQEIDILLQKQQYRKVSNMLQELVDIEIEKKQNIKENVEFFNKLYDKLYYYIIFQKIDIEKPLAKQLESLAMPFQSKTEEEWKELLEKIRKENT